MRNRALISGLMLFLAMFPAPPVAAGSRAGLPASPSPDLSRSPELRDPFYRRGVEFLERFRREDLGQAFRLFADVAEASPSFAPAYGGMAEVRALRYLWGWDSAPGTLEKAIEQGKRGVELDPSAAAARVGLGVALMAANRYTPALAELDRAVELDSDSFRAHLYRGMALRGKRRLEEASREAARLLEILPSSGVSYAFLGDCYQDRRNFPSARRAYLVAAQLDQKLLWPRLGLAAAYQRELNYQAAGKTYDATEKDFPDEAARLRILSAALLLASQDYDSALKLYQAVPDTKALSPPLYRRLVQAGQAFSLEKLGRNEEAEFYWNQLVEEYPVDFDGGYRDREVVSQGLESLARYYDGKGENRRAEILLEKYCRAGGLAFKLYAMLADRLRAGGFSDLAVEALQRGLRGTSESTDLVDISQSILPVLRSLGAGKLPDDSRGKILVLLHELAEKVEQSRPESYVPHLNLARAEALFGEKPRAIEHLREAVRLGFTGIRNSPQDPDFKALAHDSAFRRLTES